LVKKQLKSRFLTNTFRQLSTWAAHSPLAIEGYVLCLDFVKEDAMVIIVAGRRIDAENAEHERFPLKNADSVADAVGRKFAALRPTALVCSAACGADLIALKMAKVLTVRRRIILPFEPSRFRSTSVVDRPGNSTWDWGAIFDDQIQEVREKNDLFLIPPTAGETASYVATNTHIITEAAKLAAEEGDPSGAGARSDQMQCLIVWEGQSRGADDLTAELIGRARAVGMEVVQINTLRPS
jgi:hypothetical protein